MKIRLEELREKEGLTQAQLSKKSGVPQPMISDIENGKVLNPTMKTVLRLAIVLGGSIDDLIDREEANNIDP